MPYKGRRRGGPGSAGGRAVVATYGRGHMARIGLLGAQALLDQHGREHMAEIGRNGYYKAMQRYGVERPSRRSRGTCAASKLRPRPPVRKRPFCCSTTWITLLKPSTWRRRGQPSPP